MFYMSYICASNIKDIACSKNNERVFCCAISNEPGKLYYSAPNKLFNSMTLYELNDGISYTNCCIGSSQSSNILTAYIYIYNSTTLKRINIDYNINTQKITNITPTLVFSNKLKVNVSCSENGSNIVVGSNNDSQIEISHSSNYGNSLNIIYTRSGDIYSVCISNKQYVDDYYLFAYFYDNGYYFVTLTPTTTIAITPINDDVAPIDSPTTMKYVVEDLCTLYYVNGSGYFTNNYIYKYDNIHGIQTIETNMYDGKFNSIDVDYDIGNDLFLTSSSEYNKQNFYEYYDEKINTFSLLPHNNLKKICVSYQSKIALLLTISDDAIIINKHITPLTNNVSDISLSNSYIVAIKSNIIYYTNGNQYFNIEGINNYEKCCSGYSTMLYVYAYNTDKIDLINVNTVTITQLLIKSPFFSIDSNPGIVRTYCSQNANIVIVTCYKNSKIYNDYFYNYGLSKVNIFDNYTINNCQYINSCATFQNDQALIVICYSNTSGSVFLKIYRIYTSQYYLIEYDYELFNTPSSNYNAFSSSYVNGTYIISYIVDNKIMTLGYDGTIIYQQIYEHEKMLLSIYSSNNQCFITDDNVNNYHKISNIYNNISYNINGEGIVDISQIDCSDIEHVVALQNGYIVYKNENNYVNYGISATKVLITKNGTMCIFGMYLNKIYRGFYGQNIITHDTVTYNDCCVANYTMYCALVNGVNVYIDDYLFDENLSMINYDRITIVSNKQTLSVFCDCDYNGKNIVVCCNHSDGTCILYYNSNYAEGSFSSNIIVGNVIATDVKISTMNSSFFAIVVIFEKDGIKYMQIIIIKNNYLFATTKYVIYSSKISITNDGTNYVVYYAYNNSIFFAKFNNNDIQGLVFEKMYVASSNIITIVPNNLNKILLYNLKDIYNVNNVNDQPYIENYSSNINKVYNKICFDNVDSNIGLLRTDGYSVYIRDVF